MPKGPNQYTKNPRPLADRLREKVDTRGGPDACHLWTGLKTLGGYGRMSVHSRSRYVTHVAWFLWHGYYPKQINHTCDIRACVNLRHLYEGTQAENMRDRDRRGRGIFHKGERHGRAKLKERQVYAIRALVRWGESHTSVARKYGVHCNTVGYIAKRKRWKYLPLTENLL